MITWEGRGNLLDARGWTQVCPVNAVGAMGKGLALTMRQRYDGLYERYMQYYSPSGDRAPATMPERAHQLIHVTDLPERVLLMCTKLHWLQASPPALVEANLAQLALDWEKLDIQRLAIPMVGCGEGRLPRDRVRQWVHRYLGPIALPVRLYV